MSIEIYYFTGTGNSLAVARDLAEKMNAELLPVTKLIDLESFVTTADTIGIVFPLYDFKAPQIIENFIKKLNNINLKYIFAVCTYGITPLKAMKSFDKLIRKYGGKLSAGFAVKMPHNGIGSDAFSLRQHENIFKNWKIQHETISDYLKAKKEGKLETSNAFISLIMSGLFLQMIPSLLKLLKQVLFKGWKSLALNVNEKCIGCESCKKICPVDNIKMVDNKPSWSDNCAGCLACLHWCPNEAIQIGQTNMNVRKYHHPNVKLSDMLRMKM